MMIRALSMVSMFFAVALAAMSQSDVAEKGDDAPPRIAARKVRVKCAVCNGKGSLKASPPDVGQFVGKINDRSHWDVKINPCPVCERGRGRRVVWDLSQPEPRETAPCMTCGWSGIKCPRSDCKDGWIVSRPQYEGRRSRRPPDVKLCPECRGVGRISCPECKGMRANLCKRCFGTGCKR